MNSLQPIHHSADGISIYISLRQRINSRHVRVKGNAIAGLLPADMPNDDAQKPLSGIVIVLQASKQIRDHQTHETVRGAPSRSMVGVWCSIL
jgi:hypothetical protein